MNLSYTITSLVPDIHLFSKILKELDILLRTLNMSNNYLSCFLNDNNSRMTNSNIFHFILERDPLLNSEFLKHRSMIIINLKV